MNQDIGKGKAVAAVLAGAASVIVIYLIQTLGHITLPADVTGAIQTLFTTGAVYFTPHGGDA